jgi:hypothetical protein
MTIEVSDVLCPKTPRDKQPVCIYECVYVYPKTRKQRAYIGTREAERENERRETVNTKIVRTPGWVSYRRERE